MKKQIEDISSLIELACDRNTSSETLSDLAKNKNWKVRQAVADNPSTPTEILAVLAKDKDWKVRQAVVWNPNIPSETLSLLAK